MKSFVLDELAEEEVQFCATRLEAQGLGAGIENLYWLPVPAHLLSPLQREHEADCGPYALALEVRDDSLRLELLVRARSTLRCECVDYASLELALHMAHALEDMIQPVAN